MTTDPTAEIRTAPAATSFAFPATGWKVGDATSVRNSNAVFRASAVHTAIIARTSQHQSAADTPSPRPRAITRTVAAACSQALCCDRTMTPIPRTA